MGPEELQVAELDFFPIPHFNALPFTEVSEDLPSTDGPVAAPLPSNESERLQALRRYDILDSLPEPIFDTLTKLGASFFHAPVCLISLIDDKRQFIKSAFGTARFGIARGESFCEYAILNDSPLIVPDATKDIRFAGNPYTKAPFNVRFYAGAPLITSDGFRLGSFCVIDHVPRPGFSKEQIEQLKQSSRLATLAIEQRLLSSQVAQTEASLMSAERVRRILESTSDCVFLLDHDWKFTLLNKKAKQQISRGKDLIGRTYWDMFSGSAGSIFEESYRKAMTERIEVRFEARSPELDRTFSVQAYPTEDGLAVFFRDVTDVRAADRNFKVLQTRFELATQFATDGIWDWHAETDQMYCSARFQEIFGLPAIEFTGKPKDCLGKFHPADLMRCKSHFKEASKGVTDEITAEYRINYGDGVWRWISTRTAIVRGSNGRIVRMAGVISDITDKKLIDSLTGLHNRLSLMERIETRLEREAASDKTFAVLFLAVDDFKRIVNSFGCDVGDRVLREIAERISETVRVGDGSLAAYLGGDEFAILISRVASDEDAATYANGLTRILSSPIRCGQHELTVSVSIGIAMGATSTGTATSLLENADVAMCQTKEKCRGSYSVFREQARVRARQRIELEADLRLALENKELVLHFQPKVLLKTGKVTGFEALIRWMHPSRGLLGPGAFIPCAEETGLILDIGRWTLTESMRFLKKWRREGLIGSDVTMAVNLSTRQLNDPTLLTQVQEVLVECNLPSYCLALEVTESALIDDAANAKRILEELKDIGVSLHLDDFGTGYSSLSYLHQFPFHCLKIDRSFIKELGIALQSEAIAKSIIHLGASLKMSVVAEGIESIYQANLLRNLGCLYGQGFLFSKPIPAKDIPEYLSAHIQELPATSVSFRASTPNVIRSL